MGTKMWDRGQIVWSANNNIILITVGVFTTIFVYFKFILVPLMLSYFMTYLLAPLMDLFELRPYTFKGKTCCTPKENEKREAAPDGAFITCMDLFTIAKVPHGLSVLATLGAFFFVIGFSVYVRSPHPCRSQRLSVIHPSVALCRHAVLPAIQWPG